MAAKAVEFTSAFVERAQGGDESARDAILKKIQPIVRAFFIKRIGIKPIVDDLVQNTLIRTFRGLPDLRESNKIMGFVMKAALFEIQDYYRGRYSLKENLFDPEMPPAHPTDRQNSSASLDVEKALSSLNPKTRKIIELREYGYQNREIAEMLNTTEAAVKMQVKRAFIKMKDSLDQAKN